MGKQGNEKKGSRKENERRDDNFHVFLFKNILSLLPVVFQQLSHFNCPSVSFPFIHM